MPSRLRSRACSSKYFARSVRIDSGAGVDVDVVDDCAAPGTSMAGCAACSGRGCDPGLIGVASGQGAVAAVAAVGAFAAVYGEDVRIGCDGARSRWPPP